MAVEDVRVPAYEGIAGMSNPRTFSSGPGWVTGRLRTVPDLAASGTFEQGVVAVDHVLKPDRLQRLPAVTVAELEASIGPDFSAAAARRIRKVLEFADPASGSPGESLSRAYMFLEGFQVSAPDRNP